MVEPRSGQGAAAQPVSTTPPPEGLAEGTLPAHYHGLPMIQEAGDDDPSAARWWQTPLAVVFILAVTLYVFWKVLFPADPAMHFPWGSDAWDHLMKGEYLYREIVRGDFTPDIFPGWYNGSQVYRFYSPLSYYLLAGLFAIAGDIAIAANWLLFLSAVAGGISMLLYRRWFGLLPVALAGAMYTFFPDNLRVAFADGNPSRALQVGLLPLLVYFELRVLLADHNGKTWPYALAGTLVFFLQVMSHSTTAAIFAVCIGFLGLFLTFLRVASFGSFVTSVWSLVLGLLLASFWFIPSMVGGPSRFSPEVSRQWFTFFWPGTSLDPFIRARDPEIFYLGLSIVTISVLVFLFRRGFISRVGQALLLTGLVAVFITTTWAEPFYEKMPLAQFLWPIRYASFMGFALLLVVNHFGYRLWRRKKLWRWAYAFLVALLIWDFSGSLRLAHVRYGPAAIAAAASELATLNGWRVSTLDLGCLTPGATYLFTTVGGREQVFGAAYQGATTVRNIVNINVSLRLQRPLYAVDRLYELGSDDLVVAECNPTPPGFEEIVASYGYKVANHNEVLTLYHRDGGPRAYQTDYKVLGIGEGAYNLAMMFPQIAVGRSFNVDDYPLEYLKQFPTIVLSRFTWHFKAPAEDLLRAYAASGGRVVVDMMGSPNDVLAREPYVLGVYAEVVQLLEARVTRDGETRVIAPVPDGYRPWQAHALQGDVKTTVTFDAYGIPAGAVAYQDIGAGQIWFLGMNLPFYAMLTSDPTVMSILEEVLRVKADERPERKELPLQDYAASSDGYSFRYSLPADADLLVPLAYHEGVQVTIDGKPVSASPINELVYLRAPAGEHQVAVYLPTLPVQRFGLAVSLIGLLLAALYVFHQVRGLPFLRRDE